MSQYPPYGGQPPGPYGEPQQPGPPQPNYPQQPAQPHYPGYPQQPPSQPQYPGYPQQPPSQAPGQGQGWPQQPPTTPQPQTAWAPQSPMAGTSPYGGYPQQPSSSSSGNRMALGIALVVLVVAAVVGGFLVVSDDDGGSTANSTTTTSAGPPVIPTPGGGGGGDDEDDDDTTSTTEPDETDPTGLPTDAVAPDDNGNLPEDVMVHFVDSLNAGDCDAAMSDLTDTALTQDGYSDRAEAVADCEASVGDGGDMGLVLENVTVVEVLTPDLVVLATDLTTGSETTSDEWFIAIDAGLWKLDGVV